MTGCPTEDELIALLDGEATINAAARTRAHLSDCARCRAVWSELEEIVNGIRAPLPALDVERAVAGVMRRIELEPRVEPLERKRRAAPALLAGSFAAAAAIAIAFSTLRTPSPDALRARFRDDVIDEIPAFFP
jgi:anti-sigma factor RsiW